MDSDPWIRFPTSSRRHQSRSGVPSLWNKGGDGFGWPYYYATWKSFKNILYDVNIPEADPLLSSFMYHQPLVDEPPAVLQSPAEDCSMKESSVDDFSESSIIIFLDTQQISSTYAVMRTFHTSASLIAEFWFYVNRNTRPSPISEKDQEEKARKCDFVQSLVLSTFLDDNF
nr:protein DEHYDRATION-INDUCED 19 homolog 4-like [Ipomoea trifida]